MRNVEPISQAQAFRFSSGVALAADWLGAAKLGLCCKDENLTRNLVQCDEPVQAQVLR